MTGEGDWRVASFDEYEWDDADERNRVWRMLEFARAYLVDFEWCSRTIREYVGLAVGDVIAIFLFEIEPAREDVDDWVWVIVGDLPPAYITTDDAPNPAAALDAYIGAMEEWVAAVEDGRPVEGLIPVNAPPTMESAQMLKSRLRFLDEQVLSAYEDDLAG